MGILKEKFIEKITNRGNNIPFNDFKSAALNFRVNKKDVPKICDELEKEGVIKIEVFRKKKQVRIGRF